MSNLQFHFLLEGLVEVSFSCFAYYKIEKLGLSGDVGVVRKLPIHISNVFRPKDMEVGHLWEGMQYSARRGVRASTPSVTDCKWPVKRGLHRYCKGCFFSTGIAAVVYGYN